MIETLNHLKSFRQGIQNTAHINKFLADNGPRPAVIQNSSGSYETMIDWDTLSMTKGIVFGLYLEMRNDGTEIIANHILLEEGMCQTLTPRQEVFLAHVDEQYRL